MWNRAIGGRKAAVLVALGFVVAVLTSGAAASPRAAQPMPSVQVKGDVIGFAQNDVSLVMAVGVSRTEVRSACYALLFVNLHKGTRTRIGGPEALCRPPRPQIGALVLAGDRAYWDDRTEAAQSRLWSVSPHDKVLRELGGQPFGLDRHMGHNYHGFEAPLAPATDGRSAYFWSAGGESGSEAGPLLRYDGVQAKRAGDDRIVPWSARLLAAGGGRYAVAHAVYDCAHTPAWSPDGAYVAYVGCEGELWVVGADGRNGRRLAPFGLNPDWSPDGSQLAYENRKREIVITGLTGGDRQVAVLNGADPAFSQDGKQLAFVRDSAVYVADVDGSHERVVVAPGGAPDWAPDGSRLVFERPYGDAGLGIVDVAGGTAGRLTNGFDTSPSWSSDGRWIAYAHCFFGDVDSGHDGCPGDGDWTDIEAVHPDGTGQRVVHERQRRFEHYDFEPSWAPDSQRVVYSSASTATYFRRYLFVAPAGRQLTRDREAPIAVHLRSGRRIAQVEPTGEAVAIAVTRALTAALVRAGRAWRIEVFGRRHRAITLTREPARELQADGHTLVFRVGRTIYVLDARRGSPRIAARANAEPIGLSIAGRRIAWAENVVRGGRVRGILLPRGGS